MSHIDLTESFLAKIAGWDAMKVARSFIERGQVLSSNWTPPILKGVVQEGTISYRAGLVLKDAIDIENMCSCRASRQWGTICAHSVAVGLHHLRRGQEGTGPPAGRSNTAAPATSSKTASAVGPKPAPSKQLLRAAEGTSGEPVELFVILPPNFPQAAAKGKVMLCFEAKWNRGRAPLSALPPNVPFRFSAQDLKLLDQIEPLGEGGPPAMLLLPVATFSELLNALVQHPRVTLGKAQPVNISPSPWRVPLEAKLEPNGEIQLRFSATTEAALILTGESTWAYFEHQFHPLRLPKSCHEVFKGAVRISRNRVPQFLSQDWPPLERDCDLRANFDLKDFILEPQAPRFMLSLTGGLAQLQAQLQCGYGPRIMTIGVTSSEESLWLPDPEAPTRYSTRDLGAEQAALGRLLRYGFTGPDAQGRYQLLGQNAVLTFFAREFPRLEKEWTVTLEERLERSTSQNLERIQPRFEITSSGEQWFDLNVAFAASTGERFSAAEIQRLVLSGQSHTRLRSGKIAVIDTGAVEELQEVLLDCAPQQHADGYRLQNAQAGFLESTLKNRLGWEIQAPAPWRERALQQSGTVPREVPPLRDLEKVLRPYQKEGVAWLNFLRRNHFGGILADEMGLGKTLQILAFIQAVIRAPANGVTPQGAEGSESGRRSTLVVCPTSLVHNWVAEARKFTPELRVLALHGAERHKLFSQIGDADLVVTSYALIRRDTEQYRGIEFDTVVLDEAQHIKNRQTQNAQSVKSIRARHRVVLTGTPLENSVLDLWSIFDFLMPGYLGSAKDFRERYELPIVRDKNQEVQSRLARRVRPFLLRRLKRDVAQDLPPKIEQVAYCELTDDQRALYQQVLDASRREIVEAVETNGAQKSRMVVLTALLRLRQICCDLRLLNLENVDAAKASGKLELFGELLQEVLDGGHRVLVFSQFVSMLHLLRERLEAEAIDYCYLDGSTPNRAETVERFQKDGAIPVFLISLKAGGVGLNLTGADTVIHFDPWWNPAVEDQAADRAHRIGQRRVVTSYKLITRGTVEEKILNLQARKRGVTEGLLSGEDQLVESLTWEEIQDLLSGG